MAVSGSGNVAVYTVEKLLELGAIPLTVSDSTGYVYYKDGMTKEDLDAVNEHKVIQHGRLTDFKTGARPARFAAPVVPYFFHSQFLAAILHEVSTPGRAYAVLHASWYLCQPGVWASRRFSQASAYLAIAKKIGLASGIVH